ncbi:hypothetical protein AVEN_102205-1 [Araneus ventricosus]|uniref:Uncharacterized protein n=1 Tax=Araneus ventricosus TaxID=182803 RepID=A0A4Y2LBI6_ARAVE|nr:hypothetical protein AVEN_102205-1 [Araneus ventricosus]
MRMNNVVEFGVALMESYNKFHTKVEEQKQYLLLLVKQFRSKYLDTPFNKSSECNLLELTRTTSTNALIGIPPLHIVARAMYLKFQIWVMRSSEAQLLLNIDEIDKFIRTSEIHQKKK